MPLLLARFVVLEVVLCISWKQSPMAGDFLEITVAGFFDLSLQFDSIIRWLDRGNRKRLRLR